MTIAEQYVEAVNNADIDQLMNLFAADGVLRHPSGTYAGREALRNFYATVVLAGQTVLSIERQAVVDDVELLQVSATSPLAGEDAPKLYAADVFLVRDGKIDALDIYYR